MRTSLKTHLTLLISLCLAAPSAWADVYSVRVGPAVVPATEAERLWSKHRFTDDVPEKSRLSYKPKYDTIGHDILRGEAALGQVTDEMFRLLDKLIDEAKTAIPAPGSDQAAALDRLKKIDDLLISHGFVYPPVGLTQLLSDGMTPRTVEGPELQRILNNPHNARRRAYIMAHAADPFYYVDCDTASFLYLAIADECHLPVYLVEVPTHNFVRWYVSAVDYVNWETMDGLTRTDEYYKAGYAIPEELVANGVFLSKMTKQDTLGYCHFCVGGTWEQKKQWKKAIDEYTHSTQQYGRTPGAWNNLGWVLVTARDAKIRDGRKAISFAQKAVSIWRSANSLDTLGCAYAEAGDFGKAVEIETEAYQLDPNPEFLKNLEAFRQNKTWIDVHPETPDVFFVVNANR